MTHLLLTRNFDHLYIEDYFFFFLFFTIPILATYALLLVTGMTFPHVVYKKQNSEIFVRKTALSTLLSARCGKIKETFFFSSALGLRRTGAIHHILMALSVAKIQIYINRTMSGKTTKNRGNLTLHPTSFSDQLDVGRSSCLKLISQKFNYLAGQRFDLTSY